MIRYAHDASTSSCAVRARRIVAEPRSQPSLMWPEKRRALATVVAACSSVRVSSSMLGVVPRFRDPQVVEEGRPKARQQAAANPVGGRTVRRSIKLGEALLKELHTGLQ